MIQILIQKYYAVNVQRTIPKSDIRNVTKHVANCSSRDSDQTYYFLLNANSAMTDVICVCIINRR